VEIELETAVRAVSTLDDEIERELELAFTALRAESTLEDEPLRVRLDV
jgi:hypothetical protein